MKTLKTIIIISFFILKANAQDIQKTFVPYYLQESKVKNFERIGAKIEAKVIGMGYGGVNQYLTILNSKYSDVRFKSDSIPKFVMKIDEGTDVLELVVLVKADKVKKRKTYRRFIQKGYSSGGTKDISKYMIIPKLKKIDNNLYEMIFEQKLEPGEYSFQPIYKGKEAVNIRSTSGKIRIYCFGIDE